MRFRIYFEMTISFDVQLAKAENNTQRAIFVFIFIIDSFPLADPAAVFPLDRLALKNTADCTNAAALYLYIRNSRRRPLPRATFASMRKKRNDRHRRDAQSRRQRREITKATGGRGSISAGCPGAHRDSTSARYLYIKYTVMRTRGASNRASQRVPHQSIVAVVCFFFVSYF